MVQSNEPVAVDKARWWQPYRTQIARSIYIFTGVLSLSVLWQIVVFWTGRGGAPLVDHLASFGHLSRNLDTSTGSTAGTILAWANRGWYLLTGAMIWAALAHIVLSVGTTVGAIVEVGISQYLREVKEAQRWRERERAIERRRALRDEARRRAAEEIRPKSRFSFTTLLIGIVIGELL